MAEKTRKDKAVNVLDLESNKQDVIKFIKGLTGIKAHEAKVNGRFVVGKKKHKVYEPRKTFTDPQLPAKSTTRNRTYAIVDLRKIARIDKLKNKYRDRFRKPESLNIVVEFLYQLEKGLDIIPQEDYDLFITEDKILKHDDPDIIKKIELQIQNGNKKLIHIDNVIPLIQNDKFIDLVIEESIEFVSIENKKTSELFSKTLNYISNKKGIFKGGNKNAGKNIINTANEFAEKIGPILEEIDSKNHKTYRSKADYLNENGIKTLRDKNWTATAVKNTLERWQTLKAKKEIHKKKLKPE